MLAALSSPRLQPLRLASGLAMFAFALLHFANHAVGLIGLDVMNQVQDWRLHLTHTQPARLLLAAALVMHVTLGLARLAARQTLRMPALEWLQIASGVAIPALLIPHAVTQVYYSTRTDFFYSYTSVAYGLWPGQALLQAVVLLVVWSHGCIGISYWLRPHPWFHRWKLVLLAAAVALPILALTGFLSAAREAHALLADPAAAAQALHWPDGQAAAAMLHVREIAWMVYGGLLALVAAIYAARHLVKRSAPLIAINYAAGPTVRSLPGASLLEISRMHGVAHASVCGGRARCSTCRVRIDSSAAALEPPEPAEQATLSRIGASSNVRLACQLRPTADLEVTRLVAASPAAHARSGHAAADTAGIEKAVAILFLDVRGFTQMSEHRLPFDVVFLLNQFFASVGEAIRKHGGWIDKYMGDGLMAVFGRSSGLATGCREAAAAAREIDLALDDLNRRLSTEIAGGIKIGIGIHAGPVVIGRIGDTDSAALTVIGRTVNEASRLEALTKDKGCQLIMSRLVAEQAGISLDGAATEIIEIRGSGTKIGIVLVAAARDLPIAKNAAVGKWVPAS